MRQLALSVGDSYASTVTPITLDWPALVRQLSTYIPSPETLKAFNALDKDAQLHLKDRGWWNGCTYTGSRRSADAIRSLDVLTFDLDHGTPGTPDILRARLEPLCGGRFASFMGSTRKHTPGQPRLRLVIPLARSVTVDESEYLKRSIANELGMALFDPVTFRANQIMFWPSNCSDGEIITELFDCANWLDPDTTLPPDWANDRDIWPLHPNENPSATAARSGKRSDPRQRDDLIGLFCRTYTIGETIHEFLAEIYRSGSQSGRWTHASATTGNGAVEYENGLFFYSHHQTDPVNGLLCNAWDLVRIHRFGALDDRAKPGGDTSKLPSSAAMRDFVSGLDSIQTGLEKDAMAAFEPIADPVSSQSLSDLFGALEKNNRGKVCASYDNLLMIACRHPLFGRNLAFNHNIGAPVWLSPMPWHDKLQRESITDTTEGLRYRDNDDMEIRDFWVRQFRGMELPSLPAIRDVCSMAALRHGFHPIRDAFSTLPTWDGIPRLDTVLSRFLGCADTTYTRAISRKFFCAVVARALHPGIKFDSMLVMIGPQGQGKSTFCETIAGNPSWYRESLPPISRMADVVSAIKSKLICEWSEMSGMASTEIEGIKAFLSSRHDEARLSYERHTLSYPRQAVLIGTSNDETPLRDRTGGRRFWPVHVSAGFIDCAGFALERSAVMSEAAAALAAGETLYLAGDAATDALAAQEEAREVDPGEETINAWLDGSVPSRGYPAGLVSNDFEQDGQVGYATTVCVRQVACEALGLSDTGHGWPPYLKRLICAVLRNRTDFESLPTTRRLKGYGSVRAWRRIDARPIETPHNVVRIDVNKKAASEWGI